MCLCVAMSYGFIVLLSLLLSVVAGASPQQQQYRTRRGRQQLSSFPLANLEDRAYVFVRVNTTFPSRYYLIRPQNGTRQLVPLVETIRAFGLDPDSMVNMTETELAPFRLLSDRPVRPLIAKLTNCGAQCFDERIRVEVEKAWVIADKKLLHNDRFIGNFVNAPITLLHGRCITVSTKLPFQQHAQRGFMTAFELDESCGYGSDEEAEIRRTRNLFNFSAAHFMEKSEDVRLLPLPGNRLAAVYTLNILVAIRPQYYMGYFEASVDPMTKGFLVERVNFLAHNLKENGQSDVRNYSSFQPHKAFGYKNWSPFLYNNTVMFVQRLNPLHVVTIAPSDYASRGKHEWCMMDTVSLSPAVDDFWKLGTLRGGTPCMLVSPDEYLTFFHTMIHLPDNSRGTYFFGAMTFSSHPPFRTLRISSAPIVDDALYKGAWMRHKFDYVYYPMGFLFALREAAGGSNRTTLSNSYPEGVGHDCSSPSSPAQLVFLLLSFGVQDKETHLADINLCDLLGTLVRVSNAATGSKFTKGF